VVIGRSIATAYTAKDGGVFFVALKYEDNQAELWK
jgi:hypothetical protein